MSNSVNIAAAMMGEPVTAPAEVRPIEVITAEIQVLKSQVGMGIMEIGNRLLEAKAQLSHGEWLPWLEEKVQFSVAQANRFMRLATEYSNSSPVTNLGMRKALALLAFEPDEREEFVAEAHIVNGEEKTADEMSVRELERAIRERKEALEAKERAEAEQQAAEQARVKMAEDMVLTKSLLESAQANALAAEGRAAALRDELEELHKQPIDIIATDVPNEAALEKARAEGAQTARVEAEKALRDKLDKAQEDAKTARDKLKEARDAAKSAEERSTEANKALTERVSTLEKQLKVAGNKNLAGYTVCFETAQEDFCRMLGHLQKIKLEGDVETFNKLVDAAHAMLRSMGDRVPPKEVLANVS